MKHQCKAAWDTCEKLYFTIFACRARQKQSVGGGDQALCQPLNKRERIGTALQHQRIQPRKHTVIITMRGVVWLILSDWPQVPVLSQHRSSQGERERSVLFQSLHQRMGKKTHHLNTITGKLVQTGHALQQLHAALIAVALQSSHSTNDCVFTQIGHPQDEELSFCLSCCLCVLFF